MNDLALAILCVSVGTAAFCLCWLIVGLYRFAIAITKGRETLF